MGNKFQIAHMDGSARSNYERQQGAIDTKMRAWQQHNKGQQKQTLTTSRGATTFNSKWSVIPMAARTIKDDEFNCSNESATNALGAEAIIMAED
ncbi:hypothetical protein BDB00DRAFT_868053 [Zychaea mexicana]|uniref:uncharacterized protein n=1 Tax=Zychaea mexicana TaxID=64656 RepID=UPI0022FED089|nr:uncharacterized protein BDB00DRAFT_868053 [Zychaea mexicana]KAI9497925.1 hypothetical protein BDB00DRAFT_868053 [Zychaea mexicana]